MATKQFELESIGPVSVYKRRGSKSIRLSVNSDGLIRVTMPTWLPYQAGLAFASQKKAWLLSQMKHEQFKDGQRLGKYHTLRLLVKPGISQPQTRLTDTEAIVNYLGSVSSPAVQAAAHEVAKRSAKAEAEQLLPQRLKSLSEVHGYQYKGLKIRHLKSRWGSCSSLHDITLNYYLMQLPWELIDYVLVHELVHTAHLNHGKGFWKAVEECIPDYKARRKRLKDYQPSLLSLKSDSSVA
ncbi:MAG: SprT family zinc-dependent metalloprotease [Candidatus Saccharimonadales bacterium]